MFDTDLSRVGELFYHEVGDDEEINLAGFIKHAFFAYTKRYLRKNSNETKQISYPSLDLKNKLSLLVIPYQGMPDLSGLRIEGEISELGSLLKLLTGNLKAEFSDLNLENISEPIRTRICNNRQHNYSQLNALGLYFSSNPETSNLIEQAVFERHKSRVSKKNTLINLEEMGLDEPLTKILSKAGRIHVRDSSYFEYDPRERLFHESCTILHPQKGRFFFDYNIKTADNKGLPAYLFEPMEKIFNLITDKFSKFSFRRMDIADTQKTFVGGYL